MLILDPLKLNTFKNRHRYWRHFLFLQNMAQSGSGSGSGTYAANKDLNPHPTASAQMDYKNLLDSSSGPKRIVIFSFVRT
jgi:hypothetical protein